VTSPAPLPTDEWPDFVSAVREALEANRLVKRYVSGSKRFRTAAFEFARRMKVYPMLLGLVAEAAAELIEQAFVEIFPSVESELLWEEALGTDNTKGGHSDPFVDFLNSWNECEKPGAGALADAVQLAQDNPRPVDYFGGLFKGPRYFNFRWLLTTAENLQATQGEDNILLPERLLGLLMNLTPQAVSDLRKLAEHRGFLVERAKHKPFVLATEFTYHHPGPGVSLAPENQEKQDKQAPSFRPTQKQTIR